MPHVFMMHADIRWHRNLGSGVKWRPELSFAHVLTALVTVLELFSNQSDHKYPPEMNI